MCEAHAFLVENGKEKMIMENVDRVDLDGDEARLVNIFGEQKIVKARIRKYNSSEGKIILMPL